LTFKKNCDTLPHGKAAPPMKIQKLIDTLNKKFPNINAVSTVEWDGQEGGVWFRMEGECHPDGRRYFSPYSAEQFHPELVATLAKFGFFCEPYDNGTLMAYD
jgi:hypothetical protein